MDGHRVLGVTLPATAYVGFALSSHRTNAYATARFDSATVTAVAPPAPSPAAPSPAPAPDPAAAPDTLTFTASPDHDLSVDAYEMLIYSAGANIATDVPVAVQMLGKPAVVSGQCAVDVSSTLSALPQGTFVVVVAALGSGGESVSAPSSMFTR